MAPCAESTPGPRHLHVVAARAGDPPGPEVIRAACAGDREAAGRVVAHVLPLARRIACAIVRAPDAAEDVVQKACIEVLEALPSFEGRSSLRSWARSIVVRVAFRHLRRERRRARVETGAVEPDALVAALHERPADALPRPVADYLARLSADHREVLVLHHVLGYTVPEIAAKLGLSPNTVKSRLRHARKNVRRFIRRDLRFGAGPRDTEAPAP